MEHDDCAMCAGHSRKEILKTIRRVVIDEGNIYLMMIGASGDLGKPGYTPSFSYTIGLWRNFGVPEVVTYVISPGILNEIRDRVREGLVLHPHKRISKIAKGYDTVFAEITEQDEIFAFTREFYKAFGEPSDLTFPRVQLIWPDEFNVFPWEDGFNEKFRGAQPEIGKWPEKGAKI